MRRSKSRGPRRGRRADRDRQAKPLRRSRRAHGASGLQAWPQSGRSLTYAGGRPTSKPTPAGHSARIARFTACLRLSSGHSDEVVQGASRLPGNLNARPSPWRPQALQAYLGHRSINSTTRYAALALAGSKTSGGGRRGAGHPITASFALRLWQRLGESVDIDKGRQRQCR